MRPGTRMLNLSFFVQIADVYEFFPAINIFKIQLVFMRNSAGFCAFFQLQIKCFWQYKEIQFALDDLPLAMNYL